MSTRRTTRASSKTPSAVGSAVGKPTALNDMPNTPSSKRNTRGATSNVSTAKLNLPSGVGVRGNSAYGTNNNRAPAKIRKLDNKASQDAIVGGLLGTNPSLPHVDEEDEDDDEDEDEDDNEDESRASSRRPAPNARDRRARAESMVTPEPAKEGDRTYGEESAAYQQAHLDSSSNDPLSGSSSSVHKRVPKKPAPKETPVMSQQKLEKQLVVETRIETQASDLESISPPKLERIADSIDRARQSTVDGVASVFRGVYKIISTNKGFFFFCLLSVIVVGLLSEPGYEKYTQSVVNGHWIPSWPATGNLSSPGMGRSAEQEMLRMKKDIIQLKSHKQLDPATVDFLQQILPDAILCKKDKHNNLQIPDDFWKALQDKIRNDNTLFSAEAGSQHVLPGISKGEIQTIASEAAETVVNRSKKGWQQFLDDNQERFSQWDQASIYAKDGKPYKSDILDRQAIIEKIQKNWEANEDAQRSLQKQIEYMDTRTLDSVFKRLNKVEHELVTHDEVNSKVSNQVRRMIAATQLEILSSANGKKITDCGLDRVNFFGKGTGARVLPYLTSPNFVFPSMKLNWLVKQALTWTLGRPLRPQPPEAALERWEEHGDCWCAPSKSEYGPNKGFGATIGVSLGRDITPDQIIIEHITPGASLEPGATPREMELFAEIMDSNALQEARHKSRQFFLDQFEYPPYFDEPRNFVRIGVWTYDATLLQSAQSFPLQVDLSNIEGAFTSKLVVHARNNWGGDQVPYTCLYRVRVMGEWIKGGG